MTEIESECAQSYRGKTAELEKFLRPGLGRGTGYKNQIADLTSAGHCPWCCTHTHTPPPVVLTDTWE